jgi:catechol 2,3-dioxygenase-like lactoylglutathione lyase family enzyme
MAQPAPPILSVHHTAFRCRDAEQTRWFYEEVLGMKLAAAMPLDELSGTSQPRKYLHLFFAMDDGNFVAFFDDPDHARADAFGRQDPFDAHLALRVADESSMLTMRARIVDAGVSCFGPIDHGFVRSIYFHDPNGVQIEVTCKVADHDNYMAEQERAARRHLTEWSRATREKKETLFGARKLDWRGKRAPE